MATTIEQMIKQLLDADEQELKDYLLRLMREAAGWLEEQERGLRRAWAAANARDETLAAAVGELYEVRRDSVGDEGAVDRVAADLGLLRDEVLQYLDRSEG